MTAAIKFFDCFAGIGGFRSGLEKAGGYEVHRLLRDRQERRNRLQSNV